MSWLVELLLGVVGSIVGFFVKYVSKKVAVGITAVAVFVSLTAGFAGGIWALISGIAAVSSPFGDVTLFLPSNLYPCVGALVSAKISVWVYRNSIRMVQLKLFA